MSEGTQSRRGGESVGCYVYGVVPADVTVREGTAGVGDPPGTVTVVRHGDVAALVSEVDVSRTLGRPEDLAAHEQLLDDTAAEVPVLPFRFGAVLTGPDAVRDELLAPHEETFRTALDELEGNVEYVVKARYEERVLLTEILADSETARDLYQQMAGKSELASRDVRVQLGELINNAIAAKRDADTAVVVDRLSPYAVAQVGREPTHERDAAHVAFLVHRGRADDFRKAVAELERDWARRAAVRLLGPLAAYDFAAAMSVVRQS